MSNQKTCQSLVLINYFLVESPKNPWKIIPQSTGGSPSLLETSITEIISAEKKERENLVRIQTKSLIYTQVVYFALLCNVNVLFLDGR